ncbi:hypothetical protein ACA29_03065 [Lederbergia galactosidilytica]|uniref:Uncharacterized protein n=1 Tax=Lederbergia galactosidilytica TaxID=217031 RepID=A0A0Q9YLF8_9BACI|nr:hypothetical protein ACA29_03065 [Lederbergia galactosidilytica]
MFLNQKIKKTPIYLLDQTKVAEREGHFVQPLLLIEMSGGVGLYNPTSKYIGVVSTTRKELEQRLASKNLRIEIIPEEDYRFCSGCHEFMLEGYYFQRNDSCYCSRECIEKKVGWKEYLRLHGEGSAFWTTRYNG